MLLHHYLVADDWGCSWSKGDTLVCIGQVSEYGALSIPAACIGTYETSPVRRDSPPRLHPIKATTAHELRFGNTSLSVMTLTSISPAANFVVNILQEYE